MLFGVGLPEHFYDADDAPAFMRATAEVLPLTHLIDGLSAAMVSGVPFSDVAADLAVVVVWTAIGTVLAVRDFSWEARRG